MGSRGLDSSFASPLSFLIGAEARNAATGMVNYSGNADAGLEMHERVPESGDTGMESECQGRRQVHDQCDCCDHSVAVPMSSHCISNRLHYTLDADAPCRSDKMKEVFLQAHLALKYQQGKTQRMLMMVVTWFGSTVSRRDEACVLILVRNLKDGRRPGARSLLYLCWHSRWSWVCLCWCH